MTLPAEKLTRICGPIRNPRYRPPSSKKCACQTLIADDQTACLYCMANGKRETKETAKESATI